MKPPSPTGASLRRSFAARPRAELVYVCLGLIFVIGIGIYLNRKPYAIADDFHYYTFYFALRRDTYLNAVLHFLSSPYNAGRPFGAALDLLGLSWLERITDLYYIRYAHLLFLCNCYVIIARMARRSGLGPFASVSLSLFLLSNPAIWHLYMVNYGSGVLFGATAALLGSAIISRTPRPAISDWTIFAIAAFISIYSYQATWPLLIIGPTGVLLSAFVTRSRLRTTMDGSIISPPQSGYTVELCSLVSLFSRLISS